jgi:hypothetical protein
MVPFDIILSRAENANKQAAMQFPCRKIFGDGCHWQAEC